MLIALETWNVLVEYSRGAIGPVELFWDGRGGGRWQRRLLSLRYIMMRNLKVLFGLTSMKSQVLVEAMHEAIWRNTYPRWSGGGTGEGSCGPKEMELIK